MRRLSGSQEFKVIAAIRAADATEFKPDVEAFAARLALEAPPDEVFVAPRPAPAPKRMRSVWLRPALLGAVLVLALTGSALAAAQKATPGSGLYGLKRTSESLWVSASFGSGERANRRLDLAERRASEAAKASKSGRHRLGRDLVGASRDEIRAAEQLIPALEGQDRDKLSGRARAINDELERESERSQPPLGGRQGPSTGSSDKPSGPSEPNRGDRMNPETETRNDGPGRRQDQHQSAESVGDLPQDPNSSHL